MVDIKALQSENKRLCKLAEQDSLTGLLNRRTIEEKINLMLKTAFAGAFIILDLDNFKLVNDQYGHVMGDLLLKEVGKLISKYYFRRDLVGRIGGDEFVIFITGEYDKSFIEEKLGSLQSRLKQVGVDFGLKKKIGFTAGVTFLQARDTFDQLYQRADCAMYSGKLNGKNNSYFYEPSMESPLEKAAAPGEQTFLVSDMKYIIQELKKSDEVDGTYFQDYAVFLSIYRLLERLLKRFGLKCHIILITMKDATGVYVNLDELSDLMDKLRESIRVSLRASDICTQYSSCQFLVMLPGAAQKDMDMITARIDHSFLEQLSGRSDVILSYSFYPLKADMSIKRKKTMQE